MTGWTRLPSQAFRAGVVETVSTGDKVRVRPRRTPNPNPVRHLPCELKRDLSGSGRVCGGRTPEGSPRGEWFFLVDSRLQSHRSRFSNYLVGSPPPVTPSGSDGRRVPRPTKDSERRSGTVGPRFYPSVSKHLRLTLCIDVDGRPHPYLIVVRV